jgi:hypothetical protein
MHTGQLFARTTLATAVLFASSLRSQTLQQHESQFATLQPPSAQHPGATCTPQAQHLVIPNGTDRVRLEADLINLLRQSLIEQSNGILNLKREKEIDHVADKLIKARK